MLKITTERLARQIILHLEGKIAGAWVSELEKLIDQAQSDLSRPDIILDFGVITFIDLQGIVMLRNRIGRGKISLRSRDHLTNWLLTELLGICLTPVPTLSLN